MAGTYHPKNICLGANFIFYQLCRAKPKGRYVYIYLQISPFGFAEHSCALPTLVDLKSHKAGIKSTH